MSEDSENKERINKEDWRKAPGIITEGTNSALAPRDYKIECNAAVCITVIKGYWLWWCSTHHQPLCQCDNVKLELKLKAFKSHRVAEGICQLIGGVNERFKKGFKGS